MYTHSYRHVYIKSVFFVYYGLYMVRNDKKFNWIFIDKTTTKSICRCLGFTSITICFTVWRFTGARFYWILSASEKNKMPTATKNENWYSSFFDLRLMSWKLIFSLFCWNYFSHFGDLFFFLFSDKKGVRGEERQWNFSYLVVRYTLFSFP